MKIQRKLFFKKSYHDFNLIWNDVSEYINGIGKDSLVNIVEVYDGDLESIIIYYWSED